MEPASGYLSESRPHRTRRRPLDPVRGLGHRQMRPPPPSRGSAAKAGPRGPAAPLVRDMGSRLPTTDRSTGIRQQVHSDGIRTLYPLSL